MFKRLFHKKQSPELSKIDYWNKWELFELFDDLRIAKQFLFDNKGSEDNDEFTSFKDAFEEELCIIEGDNVADFTRMWEWFAPGKEWDTIIGLKGKEIGDRIYQRTDWWKRNQDFLPGAKVTLNNEYGVVLDKDADDDLFGLIRWDTNKENDTEDWRGLFGSFLDAGGQVLNQDHLFTYINDDGTMKKNSS